MGKKSLKLVYLLLAFVFFSLAAIFSFGFNIILALTTFLAAQAAFMILLSQVKFRGRSGQTESAP